MSHRSGRGRRPAGQCGFATVWAIAWMVVCLTIGFVAAVAATAEARQHSLDASADLVSLSAAASLQRGEEPCITAARVAAANSVALVSCSVEGADVLVVVRTHVVLPLGLHPEVSSLARAGP